MNLALTRKEAFRRDHKDVGPTEIKILDEGLGIVEAIVSVTDVLDDVGDIIKAGSYTDTLKVRTPKCVWSHDWDTPVGKTLDAYELLPGDPRLPQKIQVRGGGGLAVTTQFNLETQRGREAYSDVKFFGDLSEWSIGYVVPPDGFTTDPKTGIRTITKIELFEYSPVLFGANPYTATLSVKTVYGSLAGRLREAGISDIPGLKELIESGCKIASDGSVSCEVKKGRYDIRKNGDQWCVYNTETGDDMPGGCHSSRQDALDHMRALYANVPDARDDGKGVSPCGCDATHNCGCGNKQGDVDPAGSPATDANPDPDKDGDDDRVTEVHVFYPGYANAAECRICRNPKAHKLHKEPDDKARETISDPGDVAEPHAYSPAGGPNSAAPDQPCLVCGLAADAPLHEGVVAPREYPPGTAPSKTAKATPPMLGEPHAYESMAGPEGPICAFCGNGDNHPYHQSFANTNSGSDANPDPNPSGWGKNAKKENAMTVCGQHIMVEGEVVHCTKTINHDGDHGVEEKAAVRSHSTATVDSTWDGSGQEAKLAEVNTSIGNDMFAWRDSDGDPTNKSSWKFPHHMVSDGKPGSANLKACSAIIAALNGGRGGTKIPSGDRQGVYNHAAKHLKDGGKEVPDLKSLDLIAQERKEILADLFVDPSLTMATVKATLKAGLKAAMMTSDATDAVGQLKDAIEKIDAITDEIMQHLGIPDPDQDNEEDEGGDKGDGGKTAPEGETKAKPEGGHDHKHAHADGTEHSHDHNHSEGVGYDHNASDTEVEHDHGHDGEEGNDDEGKSGSAKETKVDVPLMGSYEQIFSQISASLEASPPKGSQEGTQMFTWVEATYPDHVLVCATEVRIGEVDDDDAWAMMPPIEIIDQQYLSYPYVVADGAVSLGDPTPVNISAVVSPKTAEGNLDVKAPAVQEHVDKTIEKLGVVVQDKVGRTLSSANADAIRGAVLALIEVLAKAGVEIDHPATDAESGKESPEGETKDASTEEDRVVIPSQEYMAFKMLQLELAQRS